MFDGSYFVGLESARTFLKISEQAKEKTELLTREAVINAYGNVLISEESIKILKGNIQIYGGFDSKLIFTRIIEQYQNGKYHFIDPGNNFDIEINNSVFKIFS